MSFSFFKTSITLDMLDDEKQKKYGNRPLTQEQKVGLLEEELINMKRQRWKLQTGGELMGYPEMLNYINHTINSADTGSAGENRAQPTG